MKLVNHINHMDQEGSVYCCLRNRVVKLTSKQKENFCHGCMMFGGFIRGGGVECEWLDSREVSNPHIVFDPKQEFISNQKKRQTRLDVTAQLAN